MKSAPEKHVNYYRIAQAINYIYANFKDQPSLTDIAEAINMSPFHFQRLFKEWAGVSPKKFIQYLSIDYAKKLLKKDNTTLLDASYDTGLSSSGRLHDLFVKIEGMTPGELKNGGGNLHINYNFSDSTFGKIIIASTSKGVCHIAFDDDNEQALQSLIKRFPNAEYQQSFDTFQQDALSIFESNWQQLDQIKLHLKGTQFQLKVWEALLTIPEGELTSYHRVAQKINKPNASRAVGTAIGKNPIAFLIPCHRVIQSNGNFGNYKWGSSRKSAIIGWEASNVSK